MTASRPFVRRVAGLVVASVVTTLGVAFVTTRAAEANDIRSVTPNAAVNDANAPTRINIRTHTAFTRRETFVEFTRVDPVSSQPTGESIVVPVVVPARSETDPAPEVTPTTNLDVDVNFFNSNPGPWNITVCNDVECFAQDFVEEGDLTQARDRCFRCFTVLTPGSPVVSAVDSPVLSANTTVGPVTVTGLNFANASDVQFLINGAIDPNVVFDRTSATTTRITGQVRTSGAAVPGFRDVRVRNTDGSTGVCVNCVQVSGIAVHTVNPTAGTNAEVRRLSITGVGFPADARVELVKETQTGQGNIPGANLAIFTPDRIDADFDLRGAQVGSYYIRVSAPDGQSNNLACSPRFNVIAPGPNQPGPTPSPTPSSNAPGTCRTGSQAVPTPTGTVATPSNTTSPTAATPTNTATGTPSQSPSQSPSPTPPAGAGRFVGVNPERVLDTREGRSLGGGETRTVQITGRANVPAGARAVVMNVTAITPTRAGFLTVFPGGGTRPLASNLNFRPGEVIANLVTVRLSDEGQVGIYNNSGNTHVAADVVGYYGPATGGSAYSAVNPDRILDTREGNGSARDPLGPGESRSLQVTGRGGVPANATAVAFNLTAISPTSSGFLTAYPSGTQRPVASNINFVRGDTIANLVIVRLGTGGRVDIFNNSGQTEVAADVVGYYSETGGSEALFTPITPERILDTRENGQQPIGPAESRELQIHGRAGVPSSATAVAFNLTAITPSSSGFLTAYPTGTFRPNASNINFVRGDVIPNLVIVRIGTNGRVSIYNNSGFTHAAADVVGYFVGTAPTATPTAGGGGTSTPTSTTTASTTATASPGAGTAAPTPSSTTTPSGGATPSTSAVAVSRPAGDPAAGPAFLVLLMVVGTGAVSFLITPQLATAQRRRRH